MAHDDDTEWYEEPASVPRGEPEPEVEEKPRFRDQSAGQLRQKLDQWKQRAEARDKAQPKLTREQLAQDAAAREQHRLRKKAARQAEHEANPQRRTSRISLTLGIAGIVGAIAIAGVIGAGQGDYEQQVAQLQAEQQELSTEIAQLVPDTLVDQDTADDPSAVADAVYADTHAARSAAEDVADAQQRFAQLYYDTNDEQVTEDAPKPSAVTAAEHRSVVAEYFSSAATVAAVDDLDDPALAVPFEDDQMDARYPWYLRSDDAGFVDPAEYEWEVGGVTPVQGNTNAVWVSWLNHDTDTGELLAWAQSHYNVEEELFTMIDVGYSATGSAQGGVSGQPDDQEPSTLFDDDERGV